MIAVDTNLLLRLMVGDDIEQARRAKAVLDRAVAASEDVLISPLVLAEFVWALRKTYKLPRRDVCEQLERLAAAPFIRLVDRETVLTAITDYRRGPADFADYLIAAYAEREGAAPIYTFDADAVRTNRFTAVP